MTSDSAPRLLLLGSQMAAGGAQHVLLTQAGWFRSNGYHVVVAFLYDKQGMQAQWAARHGMDIVNLESWSNEGNFVGNAFRLLRGSLRLYRLISRDRIDVIEAFTHHANLFGLPVAWLKRIPVRIGTHHGRPVMSPTVGRLHGYVANTPVMTHMVAVSEHVRQEAVVTERIKPGKVSVIPNGICMHRSQTDVSAAAARVRAELGVSGSSRLMLSVGRLVPEKGQRYLIDAMPTVLEQCPDAILAIAGDGPLRGALEQQVQKMTLGKAVRFLGNRSDVPELLAASDMFAYSSVREGCPLALLEALSTGVPIVSSAFDGITTVLEHGKTALLVPTRDPEALAAALIAALDSPELRQKLASAGFDLVAREFTTDAMCRRYDRLFRELGKLDEGA